MTKKDIPAGYWKADSMLGKHTSCNVCHNTRLLRGWDYISLYYHATAIVRFYRDGTIILNSGGWHTSTTKDRMNRCLRNTSCRIYQKNFRWYVHDSNYNAPFLFVDGFVTNTNQLELGPESVPQTEVFHVQGRISQKERR